jgi:hypothetical protein
MPQDDAGARLLRFPLERRFAAMQAELDAEKPSERDVEYVRLPGWFGVRLRPPGTVHVEITRSTVPVEVVVGHARVEL